MKESMLRVVAELKRCRLDARLVAQLHDEVVFEVREEEAAACVETVRQVMEAIGNIDEFATFGLPPMPVSVALGPSWGQMQPM